MKALIKALEKAGLEYKLVNLTENRKGIFVLHDYSGLYPNEETLQKHRKAIEIARKYKLQAEKRGFYTSTLIYLSKGAMET